MRWAVLLTLALLVAGCTSGHRAGGRRVVLSESGRIGPLGMDRSTRADVVSFAGKPDAERRGVEYDSTPYLALGYDCSAKRKDDAFPVLETPPAGRTGPACKTVFWLNRRTGRLGDFYTSSDRYTERAGVRIGMKTAEAERLLGERVTVGCEANLYPGGREGVLTVAFTGGMPRRTRGASELHLIGGHVYAFALHGGRSDIGIFDCL